MVFRDRTDAGRALAERLMKYANQPDILVLALPRGGVPVGFAVASALRAPLDVFLVRKLGVPGHEELALGAIASGGIRVFNEDVIERLQIPDEVIDQVTLQEQKELQRRERAYRGTRPAADISHRTIILVDDGLATGASMRAAVMAVRERQPRQIVVAVPVGAPDTCEELKEETDEVICVDMPEPFHGVGAWYNDFSQTTDEEVRELLLQAEQRLSEDEPSPMHSR